MKLYRSAALLCLLVLMASSCRGQDDLEDEDEEDMGDEDVIDVEDEDEFVPTETVVRERPEYQKPIPKGHVYFAEPFDSQEDFNNRWVKSNAKKEDIDDEIAKYDGVWALEEPKDNPINGDLTLMLKSKAKHHAISAKMDQPFKFEGKPFIVQYEVKFLNGIDCGGAYVKLLSKDSKLDLHNFRDKTPYTIMFGPDKCGMDHKLHFIFRHKHKKTGEFEEKHAKKPDAKIDGNFSDKKTHLYRLIVKPDNTFEIYIDRSLINSGSLLSDFSPPVNPPKEIEDPDDSKPETWDEREKIPDPDATKPDDWDESEPEMIVDEDAVMPEGWLVDEQSLLPDPNAEKPSDWDDDMDGEWEAPMITNPKCEAPTLLKGCGEWKKPTIKNPKYKGKWRPVVIDNPDYQGIWKPKLIDNPNYFEDIDPYKMTSISAVGLELWSMTEDIVFDNFLITDSEMVADAYAVDTWDVKHEQEMAASSSGQGVFQSLKGAAEERPWLWAVYVVVLLLPVVLLSICLCPKSGPVKPADIAAKKKKTDDPTPDDEDEDKEPAETPDTAAGGDAAEDVKKPSKSSLEAENADDAGDEGDMEDEAQAGSSRRSPRKRTTRKD